MVLKMRVWRVFIDYQMEIRLYKQKSETIIFCEISCKSKSSFDQWCPKYPPTFH